MTRSERFTHRDRDQKEKTLEQQLDLRSGRIFGSDHNFINALLLHEALKHDLCLSILSTHDCSDIACRLWFVGFGNLLVRCIESIMPSLLTRDKIMYKNWHLRPSTVVIRSRILWTEKLAGHSPKPDRKSCRFKQIETLVRNTWGAPTESVGMEEQETRERGGDVAAIAKGEEPLSEQTWNKEHRSCLQLDGPHRNTGSSPTEHERQQAYRAILK